MSVENSTSDPILPYLEDNPPYYGVEENLLQMYGVLLLVLIIIVLMIIYCIRRFSVKDKVTAFFSDHVSNQIITHL